MHGPAVRPFELLGGLPLHSIKGGKGRVASRHPDVSQRIETPMRCDYWPVYFCLQGSPWPARKWFRERPECGAKHGLAYL